MRHAHRVHIHVLDQIHIQGGNPVGRRTSQRGPRDMVADPAQSHALAVDQQAPARRHFDRAKAESLFEFMQHVRALLEPHHRRVKRRRLRRPQGRGGQLGADASRPHPHGNRGAGGVPSGIQ